MDESHGNLPSYNSRLGYGTDQGRFLEQALKQSSGAANPFRARPAAAPAAAQQQSAAPLAQPASAAQPYAAMPPPPPGMAGPPAVPQQALWQPATPVSASAQNRAQREQWMSPPLPAQPQPGPPAMSPAAHQQPSTPSASVPTGPAAQWTTPLAPSSATAAAQPAAAPQPPAAGFNPGAAVPIHKSASHNVLSSGSAAPLVGLPKGFNPGDCGTPPIQKSASQVSYP